MIKPNLCLVLFASEDLCVFVWGFLSCVWYTYCVPLTTVVPIFIYFKQFGKTDTCFIILDILKPFRWSDLKITYQQMFWGLNSKCIGQCGWHHTQYPELLQLSNGVIEFVSAANNAMFYSSNMSVWCVIYKCNVGTLIQVLLYRHLALFRILSLDSS